MIDPAPEGAATRKSARSSRSCFAERWIRCPGRRVRNDRKAGRGGRKTLTGDAYFARLWNLQVRAASRLSHRRVPAIPPEEPRLLQSLSCTGMDHSNGESVLSVPDADGIQRIRPHDSRDGVALAGLVARDLLAFRDLSEMEVRVLETICHCVGADWSALYRPSAEGMYRLVSAFPVSKAALPEALGPQSDRALSTADGSVVRCDAAAWPGMQGVGLLIPFHGLESRSPVVICGSSAHGRYEDDEIAALQLVAAVCATALQNSELIERLRSEVFIDVVTGCYNRRAFDEHLKVELVRAQRYGRPLCLLLLDLDAFKPVNDILGHPAGDHVLRKVGETLRNNFRTTDRVCRYGGDEFAVIFPETQKDDVVRLAERLRRQIARLFPDPEIPHPLTASIGIASFPQDGTRPEDLLRFADIAMYGAKSSGRNQIGPR